MRRVIKTYNPDKYAAELLAMNKAQWLKEVTTHYNDVLSAAEEIESQPGMAGINGADVERIVDTAMDSFQKFTSDFHQKCGLASANPTANGNESSLAQKTKVAEIEVRIGGEKVDLGVRELQAEIRKYVDWNSAPSHVIEIAMKSIESWLKQLNVLQDLVWATRRNTEVYNLDPAEMTRCETAVNTLRAEVEDAVEKICFEDQERALYSLNQAATTDTEYPTYGGEKEENFVKFQKEFIHALKVNRVRADQQVSKLRECLSGGPKDLVPATMTSLQSALDILSPIYGDAGRLIESRKLNLQNLGDFPDTDDFATASEVREMIEWLVQFEHNILELYDLAAISDEYHGEIFSMATYRELLGLFNLDTVQKLAQSAGSVRDKVDDVYQYAVEKRETLQRSLRYLPDG